MRNGLYRVQFATPLGQGTGVVYAQDGKMWGGDAGLYYVGSYSQAGDQVTGEVRTNRHTQDPNVRSVLGVDRATIMLKGRANGDTATLAGTSREAPPGVTFQAVLTRISD